MSPGRFKAILRDQLRVSEQDFWRVLQTGEPATRPSAVPEEPPSHPLWVVRALKDQLHLSEEEMEALSPEDAERLVHDHWSKPSDE